MTNQRRGRPAGRRAQVTQGKSNLSDNDIFLAEMEDTKPQREVTRIEGESEGATFDGSVIHDRPGTVTMFKPTPRGFFPRTVTRASAPQLIREGWLPRCPDCGQVHGMEPNVCAGKEPVAIRICPVCGKKIPDNAPFEVVFDDDDPNVIRDTAYENSTPASRTKAQLDLHLWTRHPQEARSLGLAPLSEPGKTVMEAAIGNAVGSAGPVIGAQ